MLFLLTLNRFESAEKGKFPTYICSQWVKLLIIVNYSYVLTLYLLTIITYLDYIIWLI